VLACVGRRGEMGTEHPKCDRGVKMGKLGLEGV
jgi:hypothetical protein